MRIIPSPTFPLGINVMDTAFCYQFLKFLKSPLTKMDASISSISWAKQRYVNCWNFANLTNNNMAVAKLGLCCRVQTICKKMQIDCISREE